MAGIFGRNRGRNRPAMKDLSRHVIPLVNIGWYNLGLELLDPRYEGSLNIIERENSDIETRCRKMLNKWLETCSTASWDKVIDALRRINLNDAASNIESLIQHGELLSPQEDSGAAGPSSSGVGDQMDKLEGFDISDCKIDVAFTRVSCKLIALLEAKITVEMIKIACFTNANTDTGIGYPDELRKKIEAAKSVKEFFNIMVRYPSHWSWINIQVMEKIASLNDQAIKLVDLYKKAMYGKRLVDILSELKDFKADENFYSVVKEKWNKPLNEITFKDLQDHKSCVGKIFGIDKSAFVLLKIATGCVENHWLIPRTLLSHAYCAFKNNQDKLLKYDITWISFEYEVSLSTAPSQGGIKRPKTESPVGAAEKKLKGEYLKGSIVRIRLHNFLTFDDLELIPGAKLNVVCGANGSGKSSIMCGICLGLAGHPKLLGRAKELKDFVKDGKSEAFIEIELFNPSGHNPVIRKQIHCDNNSSTWILNGKSSQLKEVKEVVSDMNVQIANKCQFLPQDMVVEFARMNSYEVLEETEKTVGTTEMFELHQKLKNMKTGHKDIYKTLKEKEELLEKKTRDNQMIENDVSQGQHAATCLKILREKKSWMFYGVARKQHLEKKKNKNKAESVWKRIHDEHELLENQMKHLDTVITFFSKNEQECKKKVNDTLKEIHKGRDTLNQLENEIDQAEDGFVDKRIQEHQRQSKLVHKRTEVEEMEHLLATMAPMEECQPAEEMDMTDVIDFTLHEDEDEEESDLDNENSEELKQLFSGKANIRLQTLWGENKECYNVVQWLRMNQSCFQRTIIEPMILVANCRDQQYLKQAEGFLNNQHKFSFVAQTEEDMIKLKREVSEKLQQSVDVILDPKAISNSEDISNYTPLYSIDEMRPYGFDQCMINLIDAPAPTLRVLCKYHCLHNVLVAKDMSHEQITRVVDEISDRVRIFFTSSDHVTIVISQYDSQVKSTVLQFLCDSEYLGFPQDGIKVETKPKTKDGNDEKVVIDLCEIEEKAEKRIKALRERKTNSTREKAKLTSTVNTMRIRLSKLENSAIDLVAEEDTCKQTVLKLRHDQVECMQRIAALVYSLTTDQREYTFAHVQQQAVVMQKEQVQKSHVESKHRLEEAEAQLNEAKRIADDTKERRKQLLLQAQKLSGLTNHSDIPPEKQQQYNSFPNDLEEVEKLMHEYQIKAEMCRSVDAGCMEQYNQRREEIKLLKQEVNELQNKYTDYTEQMEEMKDKWLDSLKSLICQVDEKFSKFFRSMGCAGEVSLLEDKDNDFSKYGIAIKVKFRPEEDLQVLTTRRQSGGERNVSTMLYLMALQGITSSPFRAVDETNQGMDPVNERRIFNLVASLVNQPNSSQYFILTPKLLKNLDYSSSVKVHIIANGAEMNPFHQWKFS